MVTFGGVLFTEMINVACADKLPLSVTVSVTTYSVGTPGAAMKMCAGLACVLTGEPSPKFHE